MIELGFAMLGFYVGYMMGSERQARKAALQMEALHFKISKYLQRQAMESETCTKN